MILRALALALLVGCTAHAPPADPGPGDTLLRYKLAPFKLREQATLVVKSRGPALTGEMQVALTGQLDVEAIGSKLKVVHRVLDVTQAEGSGAYSTLGDGSRVDLAKLLREASGAEIVDVRGELDKAASKTLTENAADKADYQGVTDAVLKLPRDLPEEGLAVGVPFTSKKSEQEDIAGISLAVETGTTVTLRGVTTTDGRRLAELDVSSERVGATEVQTKGLAAGLSFEGTSAGTLVFDLDAQLPVSLRLKSTVTMEMPGQAITIETDHAATYTPV